MIRTGAVGRYAKEKGPQRGPFRQGAMLQKPVQVGATPPSVLGPMPSTPVLSTLDSPSVQLRPNPAFPVTLPIGAAPRSPDPKTSRMPSPPGGTLFWIVFPEIWACDLNERNTPAPTLLVMIASRMVTDEPLKAKMPPCEAGLPFPLMVLTVVKSKRASPKIAELLTRLTPVPPVWPEIVFPPMMSALSLARLIPLRRLPGAALVPLPVISFIAMSEIT